MPSLSRLGRFATGRTSADVGGSWWIGVRLQIPANEERIDGLLGKRIVNSWNKRGLWKQ